MIQKLSVDVIHRIAAGEVVQRPSAALKELLENAIDAHASNIHVACSDGGLSGLQVRDDGDGIDVEDYPLLCERFATSKLKEFSDLERISTFGFRGEALASLSYVGRVAITSKRRAERSSTASASSSNSLGEIGWKGYFADGKLLSSPPLQPCAANVGTTVRVEHLFSTMPTRRAALKASEEWSRVVDTVTRYAFAFPKVGFSCWKDTAGGEKWRSGVCVSGTGRKSLSAFVSISSSHRRRRRSTSPSSASSSATTPVGISFPSQSTTIDNIRAAYGSAVASHMRLWYHVPHSVVASCVSPPCPTTPSVSSLPHHHSQASWQDVWSTLLASGASSSTHSLTSPPSSVRGLRPGQEEDVWSVFHPVARQLIGSSSEAEAGSKETTRTGVVIPSPTVSASSIPFLFAGYTSALTLQHKGVGSSASGSGRSSLTLFINYRLVDHGGIRRVVDSVYAPLLSSMGITGRKPVTILFLVVPGDALDVNMHPTKKEVGLLYEDVILSQLASVLRETLLRSAQDQQLDMMKLSAQMKPHLARSFSSLSSTWGSMGSSEGNGRPRGGLSTLGAGGGGGGSLDPSTVVRVEHQRGEMDAFLKQHGVPLPPPAAAADHLGSPAQKRKADPTHTSSVSKEEDHLFSPAANAVDNAHREEEAKRKDHHDDADAAPDGGGLSPPVPAVVSGETMATSTTTTPEGHTTPLVPPVSSLIPFQWSSKKTMRMTDEENEEEEEEDDVMGDFRHYQAKALPSSPPPPHQHVTLDGTVRDGGGTVPPVVPSLLPSREEKEDHLREDPSRSLADPIHTSSLACHCPSPPSSSFGGMFDDDRDRTGEDAAKAAAGHPREETSAVRMQWQDTPVTNSASLADDGIAAHHTPTASAFASPLPPSSSSSPTTVIPTDFECQELLVVGDPSSTSPSASQKPLPPLLTSVAAIVQQLNGLTSPSAEAFQEKMCFVGVINECSFLIQYDLHLLVVDTRQMAKEFVFQSIFRRWATTRLPRQAQYTLCATPPPWTEVERTLRPPESPPSLSGSLPVDFSILPPPPLSFLPRRKEGADTVLVKDPCLSVSALLLVALGRDLRGLSAERYLSDELVQLLQSALSTGVHEGDAPPTATTTSSSFASSLHPFSDSHHDGMSLKEKQQLVRLVATDALSLLFEPVTRRTEEGTDVVQFPPTPVPKKNTALFVRRLTKRLIHWRSMLAWYFGIQISRAGVLEELPQEMDAGGRRMARPSSSGGGKEGEKDGMGPCVWLPHLTLVPLLLLRLADCVPYPFASPSFSSENASWGKKGGKTTMTENGASATVVSSSEKDGKSDAFSAIEADYTRDASRHPTEADAVTMTTAVNAQKACAEEVLCLSTIARHMAEVLYGIAIPVGNVKEASQDAERIDYSSLLPREERPSSAATEEEEAKQERIARERCVRYRQQVTDAVQYGLFPCLKQKKLFKLPSDCLINGSIQHIVSVDALYKVFERC